MKNHIKKFLFIFVAVLCFSITAAAQKTEDKKGERKPPVIVPNEDRKPKDKKDKDKKDKKDGKYVARFVNAKVGVNL